jgi:hypothetical protein
LSDLTVSGEDVLRNNRADVQKSSAVISATNLETEFGSKKASLLGGERCQEKHSGIRDLRLTEFGSAAFGSKCITESDGTG